MIPLYLAFSFTGFEGLAKVRCFRLMHTPGMRLGGPLQNDGPGPWQSLSVVAPGSGRPGSAAPSWPLLLLHRLTYKVSERDFQAGLLPAPCPL